MVDWGQASNHHFACPLRLPQASVAAISLVVDGIGIMNIMLVSVTERTRETGRRRHRYGAWRPVVVCAEHLAQLGHGPSTVAVVTSFGFAAAVGVVIGYVPARRAAALMPTEALRYE